MSCLYALWKEKEQTVRNGSVIHLSRSVFLIITHARKSLVYCAWDALGEREKHAKIEKESERERERETDRDTDTEGDTHTATNVVIIVSQIWQWVHSIPCPKIALFIPLWSNGFTLSVAKKFPLFVPNLSSNGPKPIEEIGFSILLSIEKRNQVLFQNYMKSKERLCVSLLEVINTALENLQIANHKISKALVPLNELICALRSAGSLRYCLSLRATWRKAYFLFPFVFGINLSLPSYSPPPW